VCVVLAIALVGLWGCGGSKSRNGDDSTPGDTVYVKGKISLRGSTPFELLLLEGDDGVYYMIDSSPLALELKRLEDMMVGVNAMVLPQVKGDAPALSVQSYELLPLATGERPIVGIVGSGLGDTVLIRGEDGRDYVVEGDFKDLFSSYMGAKVWIVGEPRFGTDRAEGRNTVMITQFGIIVEPRRSMDIE
jgi:hypothetical protein